MNITKILSIVFLLIAVGLAYFLVDSIKFKIDEEERIAKMESRIINKLKMIREAQIAYQGVKGRYASNWDSLLAFVDTGKIFITQRREETTLLEYGAEEVTIYIDTLGSVSVRDSIFSKDKFPTFNLATLPMIPGTDNKRFGIWADKIDKSGVKVDVVEVWNTVPVDPDRSEDEEAFIKKPLRFGSRTSITTAGNWE